MKKGILNFISTTIAAISLSGCGEYSSSSILNGSGDDTETDQIKFFPPSNLDKEIKCNLE